MSEELAGSFDNWCLIGKSHLTCESSPQALKRGIIFQRLCGTTEVVPFPFPARVVSFRNLLERADRTGISANQ